MGVSAGGIQREGREGERSKGDTSGRDWGDSAAIGWARFVKENQCHVRQAGGLQPCRQSGSVRKLRVRQADLWARSSRRQENEGGNREDGGGLVGLAGVLARGPTRAAPPAQDV